jgi:hypothetical protein
MYVTEEEFAKMHSVRITELNERSTRFKFQAICTCASQGLFLTREDAEMFEARHLEAKRKVPFSA